jgi:hypothetical protein
LRSFHLSATLRGMEGAFRYRSQIITAVQVEFIRQLITQHPGATRRRLSLLLCEAWDWKQANGAPRDMVCRRLLLGLHRAGRIDLGQEDVRRLDIPVHDPLLVRGIQASAIWIPSSSSSSVLNRPFPIRCFRVCPSSSSIAMNGRPSYSPIS